MKSKDFDNKSFDDKRIAQGYKERPFLHKQVIARFQRDITDKAFSNGLDVGCGAGLSSQALRGICDFVTGADISAEMINAAKETYGRAQGYDFIVSKAEEIPALGKQYDIATAAGVISWVERAPFLQNLKRLMCAQGYVLIYDFCISDRMKDSREYSLWWHDAYLKEFPKPLRNESVWTGEDVEPYGFSMLEQVQYEMEYEFDMDSFIKFMLIQSNVNARLKAGERELEEVHKWFSQSLAPIFGEERKTLIFTGYSWYMRAKKGM